MKTLVITPHGYPFTITDSGFTTAASLPVRLFRPAGAKTPEVSRTFATVEQAEGWADIVTDTWAAIYGEGTPVLAALHEAKQNAEFAAFLDREIEAARARYHAQTPEQKERIRSWNEYAARKNSAA